MGCCLPLFDCCFCTVQLELGAGPNDENSSVLKLRDGRQLGYIIVGADVKNANRYIFYHHGHPTSRLDIIGWDLSFFPDTCIIGVDRPGAGLSENYTGRKVSDHTQDVLQLADHLGIKKFGVIGHSGGGPYALSDRALMPPERLEWVVCIAGLAPVEFLGLDGMFQENVDIFTNPRKEARNQRMRTVWIGTGCLQTLIMPEAALAEMPKADQAMIRANPEYGTVILKSYKEGLRDRTLDTFVDDCDIYSRYSRWGFKREDVKGDIPLTIVQGDDDNNVPPSHGAWFGETPGARVIIGKGHGHFTVVNSKDLSKLVQACFSGELDSYQGYEPASSEMVGVCL